MAGPTLPVVVALPVKQIDGENDGTDVYQTHRGKMPTTHGDHGNPPNLPTQDQFLRYP